MPVIADDRRGERRRNRAVWLVPSLLALTILLLGLVPIAREVELELGPVSVSGVWQQQPDDRDHFATHAQLIAWRSESGVRVERIAYPGSRYCYATLHLGWLSWAVVWDVES